MLFMAPSNSFLIFSGNFDPNVGLCCQKSHKMTPSHPSNGGLWSNHGPAGTLTRPGSNFQSIRGNIVSRKSLSQMQLTIMSPPLVIDS